MSLRHQSTRPPRAVSAGSSFRAHYEQKGSRVSSESDSDRFLFNSGYRLSGKLTTRLTVRAAEQNQDLPGFITDAGVAAGLAVSHARLATGQVAVRISSELFNLTGARATLEKYGLDRHWRNARTHTLRDPERWRVYPLGNFHLNGVVPKNAL